MKLGFFEVKKSIDRKVNKNMRDRSFADFQQLSAALSMSKPPAASIINAENNIHVKDSIKDFLLQMLKIYMMLIL